MKTIKLSGQDKNPVHKNKWISLPAIIIVAIVTQIPIIITLINSMTKWIIVRPDIAREFVGIKYYQDLLTSEEFWLVLFNTVFITIFSLAICFTLGILLAICIYRHFPGVGIIRTLLIAPFFISDAVIGVFWRNVMLNATYGLLPYLTGAFGATFPELLAQYPRWLIILLIVWKWTPFFMLVLTSGLQAIPKETIEASIIDGASGFNRTFLIILPQLRAHINISGLLGFIFILKTFGLIFTSTHGGPGFESTNFPYYVYRVALLGWDVGKGASIAVLIVIIFLAIISLTYKVLRKTIGGTA